MSTRFKEKLSKGELLIGTLLTLPSPEIAELLTYIGFNWLFIDMEHGLFNFQDVQRILQTIDGKCPGIIRVPANDETWIKKGLDLGCDGLIFPLVSSKEEVEKIIRCVKFPPEGSRSVGIARAHRYGLEFQSYIERANRDISIILQIETIQGVSQINELIQVPGVDAIFLGPYDLSGSLGKIGQVQDPEVKEAIETVFQSCQRHRIPIGIFGANADAVKPYIKKGFTLIAAGMDTLLLSQAASNLIKEITREY